MVKDEVVIAVKDVSKDFILPHEERNSVKTSIVTAFKHRDKSVEIQHALKNIDFQVNKGEFFGIVGRNGSGKSTLLKILAGIYQPSAGSVGITGRLVPFIELGVGFNPELTGRENVYLNGGLMGFSDVEVDKKYQAIVAFSELERFMDQKLKNYSSGMQVRLAFSVATVLAESDILLIDEVLAVGDADFQRKCFEYFRMLKRQKKTVVFVSHDMSAVREYCDRAILIEKSEIIFSDTADGAAKEYTRLFLPDVYEAEQEAELRQGNGGKWGTGSVDIRNLKTHKAVYDSNDEFVNMSYDIVQKNDFTDEIIPGFTIKNSQGSPICGTNSKIIRHERVFIDRNKSTVSVTWKIPNVFSDGTYVVEPAVVTPTNTVLQWWDDGYRFDVVNEKSTPYPVSPVIDLRIT